MPSVSVDSKEIEVAESTFGPVQVVTEPFKKIPIDVVGELPRSTSGYKYILAIVDYARRYLEAIPL